MRRFLVSLMLITGVAIAASAQRVIINVPCNADKVVQWWNNNSAPHSNEESKDEVRTKHGHFKLTSQTEFYIYKADSRSATGQGVVVIPGGGYGSVCVPNEGFRLAEYFQSLGITALVLKYRLPNYGHKEVPLEDAQAALDYLRKNAKKLGIDPAKVGIAGSSAGGHLAAYTSTFTEDAKKPAFTILFYPVISGESTMTHRGTFIRLLGKEAAPYELEYYSLNNRVSATTPPTILLLSNDDRVVPPINSVLYYKALKHYGVEAAMHIYPEGGHGWVCKESFRYHDNWQHLLARWLQHIDKKSTKDKR